MDRVLSKWPALLATLLMPSLLCFAQKPVAIPLVPAADWQLAGSQNLGLDSVRNYGGDPAIEREYGVKSIEHRTYALSNTRVDVIMERASDASAAYGLLTLYQTESMVPEKAIELAVSSLEGSMMARGRSFMRFLRTRDSRLSENDLRALLILVGGTKASPEARGNLPTPLPTTGLVSGTEKYLLGPEAARRALASFRTDLIGFDQGAEAQTGEYGIAKRRSTLIAISYPTPQIARARFGAMSSFLGINQEQGPTPLYGRRQGSFVFLVMNANADSAAKLMDEFKVAQRVSWNERYPGNKPFIIQVVEMVLADIMLSFILVGFCVLGGVLFFLSKRAAGRLLPSWQWGHPDQDTLIRLNLR